MYLSFEDRALTYDNLLHRGGGNGNRDVLHDFLIGQVGQVGHLRHERERPKQLITTVAEQCYTRYSGWSWFPLFEYMRVSGRREVHLVSNVIMMLRIPFCENVICTAPDGEIWIPQTCPFLEALKGWLASPHCFVSFGLHETRPMKRNITLLACRAT